MALPTTVHQLATLRAPATAKWELLYLQQDPNGRWLCRLSRNGVSIKDYVLTLSQYATPHSALSYDYYLLDCILSHLTLDELQRSISPLVSQFAGATPLMLHFSGPNSLLQLGAVVESFKQQLCPEYLLHRLEQSTRSSFFMFKESALSDAFTEAELLFLLQVFGPPDFEDEPLKVLVQFLLTSTPIMIAAFFSIRGFGTGMWSQDERNRVLEPNQLVAIRPLIELLLIGGPLDLAKPVHL